MKYAILITLFVLTMIVTNIGTYYHGHTTRMIDREEIWREAQVKAGITEPTPSPYSSKPSYNPGRVSFDC